MLNELLREMRKTEIRLKAFVDKEREYVETVKMYLGKIRELSSYLETLREGADKEKIEKAVALRLEVVERLSEVLRKGGEAEHERSHLLESFGDLLLSLERALKNIEVT